MLREVFFCVMLLDREIDQNYFLKRLLRKAKILAWVKRIPAIAESPSWCIAVAAMPGVTDL